MPILIGDYVLYSYGTGCVMGVPAHDERDFVFAQKHGLPIKRVVCGAEGKDELPFTEYGVMTNSGEFDGMTSEEGRRAVVEKLARKNKGELKIKDSFSLRERKEPDQVNFQTWGKVWKLSPMHSALWWAG